MRVRAARGAIVVDRDEPEVLFDATERLLASVLERNEIEHDDLISVLFTATDDLRSAFPAEAAGGWARAGAADVRPRDPGRGFDAVGGPDPAALPLRAGLDEIVHVYLDGAESLRDDLDRPERVAVVGTGLIGTSIAMAASRVGCDVVGWDPDPASLALAAERGPVRGALSARGGRRGSRHRDRLRARPGRSPTSRRGRSRPRPTPSSRTRAASRSTSFARWRAGGSGRPALRRWTSDGRIGASGPEHASASVVDGIVWVLTPDDDADPRAVAALEAGSGGSAGVRCGCRRPATTGWWRS